MENCSMVDFIQTIQYQLCSFFAIFSNLVGPLPTITQIDVELPNSEFFLLIVHVHTTPKIQKRIQLIRSSFNSS